MQKQSDFLAQGACLFSQEAGLGLGQVKKLSARDRGVLTPVHVCVCTCVCAHVHSDALEFQTCALQYGISEALFAFLGLQRLMCLAATTRNSTEYTAFPASQEVLRDNQSPRLSRDARDCGQHLFLRNSCMERVAETQRWREDNGENRTPRRLWVNPRTGAQTYPPHTPT